MVRAGSRPWPRPPRACWSPSRGRRTCLQATRAAAPRCGASAWRSARRTWGRARRVRVRRSYAAWVRTCRSTRGHGQYSISIVSVARARRGCIHLVDLVEDDEARCSLLSQPLVDGGAQVVSVDDVDREVAQLQGGTLALLGVRVRVRVGARVSWVGSVPAWGSSHSRREAPGARVRPRCAAAAREGYRWCPRASPR